MLPREPNTTTEPTMGATQPRKEEVWTQFDDKKLQPHINNNSQQAVDYHESERVMSVSNVRKIALVSFEAGFRAGRLATERRF